MRSQSIGTKQANRNVMDGKSLLQIADGASGGIQDLIRRAQELAIQSANGTLSTSDRANLNQEFDQIKMEIDRIAESTTFNGINLLSESGVGSVSQDVISNLKLQIPHWIDDAIKNLEAVLGLDSLPTGANLEIKLYNEPTSGVRGSMSGVLGGNDYVLSLNLGRLLDNSGQIIGGTGTYPDAISGGNFDTVIAHEILHNIQFTKMRGLNFSGGEMWFIEGLASAVQGRNTYFNNKAYIKGDAVVSTNTWNGDYEASFAAIKTLHEITTGGIQAIVDRLEAGETLDNAIGNTVQFNQGEFTGATMGAAANELHNFQSASDFIDWFNNSTDVDFYLNNSTDFTNGEGAILNGAGTSNPADVDGTIPNNTTIETGANNAGVYNITFADIQQGNIRLHTGYKDDDIIEISKGNLTTSSLGIENLSIATQADSENAIKSLEESLNKVSEVRGKFGSYMNRIDFISQNLNTLHIQTDKTKSVIADTDFAKEMSEYMKNEILSQSTNNIIKINKEMRFEILKLLQE